VGVVNLIQTTVLLEEENLVEDGIKSTVNLDSLRDFVLVLLCFFFPLVVFVLLVLFCFVLFCFVLFCFVLFCFLLFCFTVVK